MVWRRAHILLAMGITVVFTRDLRAQSPHQLHRLPSVEIVPEGTLTDGLFAGHDVLSATDVVELAVARNPSVDALVNAWRAAAQRYPQVVSLDDPMFMAMSAPASFGSNDVESAYVLQGSQKLPWRGKRAAKGRAASAEATATLNDLRDARLEVARMAHNAYYDYYLAHRQIELTRRNSRIMREFRDTAQTKYENNLASEQDVVQADIELAEIERRQIELERARRISVARINTLLLRDPGDTLPLPPSDLQPPDELPPTDLLRQLAVNQRPDLAAIAARIRAEQANLTLATKQYYPDVDVFGRYDSFWQPVATQSDLRGQIGVNLNVPIFHRRLSAGVCEARFRVAQRQAEYDQKLADIQFEVQQAHARLDESWRIIELYRGKFKPAAERGVSIARNSYDVGKASFADLVRAQRQSIELAEKTEEALVDYYRNIAELERAVGGAIPEVIEKPDELRGE